MQSGVQVEWDFTYMYNPSWEFKLFAFYCLFVLGFSLVRSLRVARQLGFFSFRKQATLQHQAGSSSINSIAASALANKLSLEDSILGPASAGLVQQADNRFQYLWEMCSIKVGSMKKLAVLTALLSALASVWIAREILRELTVQKVFGPALLTARMNEVLVPFASGILVCVLLYTAYSFFEGSLIRRRASWNYFAARVRSAS